MDVLMEMTWSDDIRRKGSRLAVPHFVSCLAWLWHPAQLAAGQWDGPGVKHCAVRTTSGRYLTVISQSGVLQGCRALVFWRGRRYSPWWRRCHKRRCPSAVPPFSAYHVPPFRGGGPIATPVSSPTTVAHSSASVSRARDGARIALALREWLPECLSWPWHFAEIVRSR